MPFAAARSEHPVPALAVGEAIGQVLETMGTGPDLVLLFADGAMTGALEDVAGAVQRLLRPVALAGATHAAPGITLLAGYGFDAEVAHAPDALDGGGARIVLADPFTWTLPPARDALVGGFASAARGAGGNRLLAGGDLHRDGAVVVSLHGAAITALVAHGCRPVGERMLVTGATGSMVTELDGQPAGAVLRAVLDPLEPGDRDRARNGLLLGSDDDLHEILGRDRDTGALALGGAVEPGAVVHLHVRDGRAVDEQLRRRLAGRACDGALVFAGVDPPPDLDPLAGVPFASMVTAGEIGPRGALARTVTLALVTEEP